MRAALRPFIEKESSINEQIDRMRHAATRALLERDDVIIVASVSCIYGIGSVETYTAMTITVKLGDKIDQRRAHRRSRRAAIQALGRRFLARRFSRARRYHRIVSRPLRRSRLENRFFWRFDRLIAEFDPLTGKKTQDLEFIKVYANSHYVTPRPTLLQSIKGIKIELKQRLAELNAGGRLLEAQRLEQRTLFDLEMLEAAGLLRGRRELFALSHRPSSRRAGRQLCSNIFPTTRWSSPMSRMSPSRRSGRCIAAISGARRRLPNTASGCRPASTTGRCVSRNGTRCGRSRSMSRRRQAHGNWSAREASSPNRSSARPASSIRRSKSARRVRKWTICSARCARLRQKATAASSPFSPNAWRRT